MEMINHSFGVELREVNESVAMGVVKESVGVILNGENGGRERHGREGRRRRRRRRRRRDECE